MTKHEIIDALYAGKAITYDGTKTRYRFDLYCGLPRELVNKDGKACSLIDLLNNCEYLEIDPEVFNFKEAVIRRLNGKDVRRVTWGKGDFLTSTFTRRDKLAGVYCNAPAFDLSLSFSDIEATDWIEC
jgi:hypothetical protein